jgi:RNA polymerase sigma-70 factor, ECF subfamily
VLTQNDLQLLYRYSYALTGDEQNAYDLLQSSIEKYLSTGNNSANKIPFLKRIIKNKHIDNYRHDKIIDFDSFDDNVFPLDYDAKDLEDLIINEDMVDKILSALNTDEREIIFYWAYEGYSAQQISDALEIPRGTILSKLHRIKARLVQQFDTDTNVPLGVKR